MILGTKIIRGETKKCGSLLSQSWVTAIVNRRVNNRLSELFALIGLN